MLELANPTPDRIGHLLAAQAALPFSYGPVGASREAPPGRWRIDHNRIELGHGAETYVRARQALARWAMFDTGWTRIVPAGTPIEVDTPVAVVARTWVFSSVNACKIIYTLDERQANAAVARYGFAYGTLPHHVARGEERFLVEHRGEDDSVWFDVLAFSRPAHWLAMLGYPYMRLCQRRFARDAKAAMLRAVA